MVPRLRLAFGWKPQGTLLMRVDGQAATSASTSPQLNWFVGTAWNAGLAAAAAGQWTAAGELFTASARLSIADSAAALSKIQMRRVSY